MRSRTERFWMWGVLGLLLALAVTGFSQWWPKFDFILTPRDPFITHSYGYFELWLKNIDIHPYRAIGWQAGHTITAAGTTTTGVARFWATETGEKNQVWLMCNIFEPGFYLFALWFAANPEDTTLETPVADMKCYWNWQQVHPTAVNLTTSPPAQVPRIWIYWFIVEVKPGETGTPASPKWHTPLWEFRLARGTLVCRVTVAKVEIRAGRLLPIRIRPMPLPEPPGSPTPPK